MHTFPEGGYSVGAEISWDVTFDLSSLAGSETGIVIRPVTTENGTLGPDSLALVEATVTLGD